MLESAVLPDQALQMLIDGNHRFTSSQSEHPHQLAGRRAEVVGGQHPFATLLSCSDSRVPPEVIFDQGLGDIFVIRNAGNLIDDVVLGSIEYAAEHLGVSLVLVLGHTHCGAVTATVQGGEVTGHIGSIVNSILPAVAAAKAQVGDAVLNAIMENVRQTVDQLKHSQPLLAEWVLGGRVKVVGGVYHLESGAVELLESA